MVKGVDTKKYAMAGVITIVIFLLGFFAGLVIEGKRINYVQDSYQNQRAEFSSSQLQYSYINTLNTKESCPAIFKIFYDNLKSLDDTRLKLETYARDNKINLESFDTLKRDYTIEQLRYWLLSKQARELCSQELVRVLYFFSVDKECPKCNDQAFVLDYLKSVFKEKLLIFALDSNYEKEPMIAILKRQYSITEFPSLVIEDKTVSGFSDRKKLLENICPLYNEPEEACAEIQ